MVYILLLLHLGDYFNSGSGVGHVGHLETRDPECVPTPLTKFHWVLLGPVTGEYSLDLLSSYEAQFIGATPLTFYI